MRPFVCLALLLLPACDALTPSRSLVVIMDSAAYTRGLSGQATVGFAVVNASPASMYFVGCETPISTILQRDSSGTWHDVAQRNTICLANITPARLTLEPGHSFRDVLEWDSPGRFRLRVQYGPSPDRLWSQEAAGPAFEVR